VRRDPAPRGSLAKQAGLRSLAAAAHKHPYGELFRSHCRLRQPERVLSVLSELASMASVGPVTLDEVLLVLSDLLLQVAVAPPNQRYGCVFIGPIDTARGLSFEAVFVPGIAEKLFPHRIIEEPILLDAARKELNVIGSTHEDPTTLLSFGERAPGRSTCSFAARAGGTRRVAFPRRAAARTIQTGGACLAAALSRCGGTVTAPGAAACVRRQSNGAFLPRVVSCCRTLFSLTARTSSGVIPGR
jgi:hypothetical protein